MSDLIFVTLHSYRSLKSEDFFLRTVASILSKIFLAYFHQPLFCLGLQK